MNRFSHPHWQYQGELGDVDLEKNYPPVRLSMPARFDLIGGWTDTPPYFFDHPAAVLNVSLDCLGIEITVSSALNFELVYNGEKDDNNLVAMTTLKFLELNSPSLRIEIQNSIPKGSGLGGSSLLAFALLAALFKYYGVLASDTKLINYVLEIEQLMEAGGGWQDQIGGLYPGIKLIETNPANQDTFEVKTLFDSAFEQMCLLIDTQVRRKAANILYSIRDKYLARDAKTIETLSSIRENAISGWKLLQTKEYLKFGRLMSESWKMVCEIEGNSRIELVDVIEDIVRDDLAGLKIGGAGGGGFILVILNNLKAKEEVLKRLKKELGEETKIYSPKFNKKLECKQIERS